MGEGGPGGLPWLIRKFVDPEAEFLFVPADRVAALATELDATLYDMTVANWGTMVRT